MAANRPTRGGHSSVSGAVRPTYATRSVASHVRELTARASAVRHASGCRRKQSRSAAAFRSGPLGKLDFGRTSGCSKRGLGVTPVNALALHRENDALSKVVE
jgi:hypothetical protein